MGNFRSDMDALIRMQIEAIRKLQKLSPGHRLLSFIKEITDDEISYVWIDRNEKTHEKFKKFEQEFCSDENPTIIQRGMNYLKALQGAVEELEKPKRS